PAILLWLSTLPEDAWVAVEDLAVHLRAQAPDWDRLTFQVEVPVKAPPRPKPPRGRKEGSNGEEIPGTSLLEAILLGAAYQFGLIRTAEEVPSGRRVVQLSPLGRYILALGSPPAPRPAFDHFLFVQPNFEMIAYRQGLNPYSIGQFSRFARWSQVGAALELKLTPDSVYRGLEGGMEPKQMLDLLAKHSPRPLPAGVAEALRTWAGRRERVTYYASATLVEFASKAELDATVAQWPASAKVAPVAISDRLLLVEDESSIPFQRLRLAGSRDYRRAPESCLEVEPDGVTLSLDLGRSDLLVDAELVRFSDEQELGMSQGAPGNPRRRFRVSAESLARASENGLTASLLSNWYVRRTGGEIPPAVRLLL
ncbi:helicase-associated domain-containing protein, partial [Singulisphaera rosea]